MPSKIGPSSASASRAKSFLATAASASSGHAENQSIVVLLIRLGNWRMRSRYCSPSGDMHITTCMCFFTILTNWPYRFVLFTGVPAAVSIGVIFSKIGPRSFSSEQIGHLARREDVVDILEEDLVDDLRVDEEEDDVLELVPRQLEHRLQVLAPLERAVVLRDLDLEELVVGDVRREPRERLAAASRRCRGGARCPAAGGARGRCGRRAPSRRRRARGSSRCAARCTRSGARW